MKSTITKGLVYGFAALVLTTGCRKREAAEADILVNFETSVQGISATENNIVFKIQLNHPTNVAVPVIINLTELGVVYGTDYTTTPASVAGKLEVTIPQGNNEATFTVSKTGTALFDGDESIQFDLYSSGSPVFIGAKKQLTLNFGELVANNANSTLNGGGVNFGNKVFFDLSANRQTAVLRTNWDLGFYTGSEDFRVILNSSSAMMAKQLSKTDLTQVTAADTVGFSTDVAFNQFAPTTTSLPYIDYPNGDITRTAIASVSATATDNKVYIVNRGTGVGTPAPARGWKKIRIIRNASGGYTLQHADIAATNFSSIDIPKEETAFFKYISFENGIVSVEPAKKKWDIAWTYFSNITNFGTGEVPYLFQDIVLQNRNVQVAKVMTSTKTFDDFAEADLAGLTFNSSQVSIGSDWRSGGGPSTQPSVKTDRFYIVRDGENNYYKLRFTGLTQNGERGYPAIEFVLVKKG